MHIQFRKYPIGLNNLAGSLIFIFEKSPWDQLNCRVANFLERLSLMGSVIRPGQLIGSEEYLPSENDFGVAVVLFG